MSGGQVVSIIYTTSIVFVEYTSSERFVYASYCCYANFQKSVVIQIYYLNSRYS